MVKWAAVKRRAIQILLGLWLLFCLVTALTWAGSHWVNTVSPLHLIGRWSCGLDSRMTGKVSIQLYHDFPTPVVGPQFGPGLKYNNAVLGWYDRLPMGFSAGIWGFFVGDEKNFMINNNRHELWTGWIFYFSVPYWFAWLMWLPFPVLFYRWRQQRKRLGRAKRGLCVNCGYDLRATPQRCPECGMAALSWNADAVKAS